MHCIDREFFLQIILKIPNKIFNKYLKIYFLADDPSSKKIQSVQKPGSKSQLKKKCLYLSTTIAIISQQDGNC